MWTNGKKQNVDFTEVRRDINVNDVGEITGEHCNYPYDIKLQAIKYYLEGNACRGIEKLMHVSYLYAINWVKQLAYKIKNIPRKNKKVDICKQKN